MSGSNLYPKLNSALWKGLDIKIILGMEEGFREGER